jgi:hypothetical protein
MRPALIERRPALAVAPVLILLVVAAVVLTIGGTGHPRRSLATHHGPKSQPTPSSSTATTVMPIPTYHPTYVSVPSQEGESAITAEWPVAALETERPPQPAYTIGLPVVPAADASDPAGYAVAFTAELLNMDYRAVTRSDLAQWTQAEAAAAMMPGIPGPAAANVLYATLFDPSSVGDSSSPIPSARQWSADVAAGVTQRVSDLFASEDPGWEQLIAHGFQSADPLMTVYDVTGTLKVTQRGKTTTERFEIGLGLGSALHHPGYGASSAAWKVTS